LGDGLELECDMVATKADLTTTEAARYFGTSAQAVRKLIQRGRLRATKHGRDWLIRAEDAASWRDGRVTHGRRRRAGVW
jgi:excisionase family DNA binding protein